MCENFRFTDKVVLITGGGAGIGRATGIAFAREGATVILVDIDENGVNATAKTIRSLGAKAEATVADVAGDERAVGELIDGVTRKFGCIDILVNNVGGSRGGGKIWDLSTDNWEYVLNLNLRGTFFCTRAVARHMKERKWGRIICISSSSYKGTPWKAYHSGGADYAAAKAGIIGFVKHVALEMAEFNVTVNAVAPGPIETPRLSGVFRHMEEEYGAHSPLRQTPLGRLGKPEEVAATVTFLASEEAGYITGEVIHVAGGR